MQLPYSNLQVTHWNPGAENPLILPIHVICNTSDDDIYDNIRTNSRLPGKWLEAIPEHDGIAILCGSGPSLADTLDEIRSKQSAGGKVFAMNGAAQFLFDNGITPDYQLLIDAREATADLIGPAKEHLFASQCHPDCFKKVPTARLWHLQVTNIDDLIPEYSDGYCLIGGAASVGNTATCLAYAMGYRNLQIYGYDSCHRGDKGHAFHQKMNDGDPCASVRFDGKDYIASLTMKLQAEKFQDTARSLMQLGCKIEVHGSGLLPDMFNAPKDVMTEQQKYERMWAYSAYRHYSPGEECVDKFLDLVKPTGLVIDFGCGTGRAGVKMKKAGCEVLLSDFTTNSRDLEAMALPFIQHDLISPFPYESQCGYCTDVMEHIPTCDVENVIRNIMNAANTVFFQISTVPDSMGAEIGQDLHLTVKPHDWWKNIFNSLGFVISYEECLSNSSIFVIIRSNLP